MTLRCLKYFATIPFRLHGMDRQFIARGFKVMQLNYTTAEQ